MPKHAFSDMESGKAYPVGLASVDLMPLVANGCYTLQSTAAFLTYQKAC